MNKTEIIAVAKAYTEEAVAFVKANTIAVAGAVALVAFVICVTL